MSKFKFISLAAILVVTAICVKPIAFAEPMKKEKIVQGQAVLTVSESKRLIAKGVAQMPIVKKAIKEGMVIICKGTTNTYVAEEITGKEIEHGSYVYGRTYPEKGEKKLAPKQIISEIILVNGKESELDIVMALSKLKEGDVVIKGANALDYERKLAAVITGGGSGGTAGKILPYVVARKGQLVIPVGLEKQIAGDMVEITKKVREPMESLNKVYPMFLLNGEIVTELEAIKVFGDVSVFQMAAGGIGGAEGCVRLVIRGERGEVAKVLKVIESVHGEPAFVK